ncbi:MAG TPA: hypothetical protein VNZ50_18620 [Hyphomicrobiaceae bacterium]|nr:hypothetical protein [Hyphomicrobiaceae bacterium]
MMIALGVEKYLPYLDGHDMTHEQKTDCINALQKFAQTFVDEAWDFDPKNPIHVHIQKCAEELKDNRSRQNSNGT